ncbi:MAG: glutamate-5-semialdehyde dehydrogenase [Prevotella sp.]|jgi:glutamate-5-semialdehyde dehydrogenase|nr:MULTISPECIES: glutamate-5-semialdehyde dehydrogenase [unclassified Prevotella]MCH3985948.1 glutamate-5-semialdehyde dehydrogenase [Prevotella sp.]MCH4185439.1 glutamate-5-semialdehyde dehydrogenase [Prevotella sp.]MCH4216601.1 glutamate-5-semialdehyde dehydrogenase [Prevotella sp.]MCI1291986.1 glutamate-5-semialdehyde dehydrogenase [Prevotella sp.]MCI1371686.1 glutamate-5-semialdehyde dehydrogenase [Prevotella sp.]
MQLEDTFKKVKTVSTSLGLMSDDQRNQVLNAVATALMVHKKDILTANAIDLKQMGAQNPMYDRLKLTDKRLQDIASDMCHVADLPSPLGRITKESIRPNGLHLRRISVPFGVIGMIYEARPNVTIDVFSLCFKSGNACILKGGKDADQTNRAEVKVIHDVLEHFHISPYAVTLLPATHEATSELLTAVGYVDLCIPRGSKRLINFVRETAKIPVIETGAGVVHIYFDKSGDLNIGKAIINNSKCRRPSVCNALDCLIIHENRISELPLLCQPLTEHQVRLSADDKAYEALKGKYPENLLFHADQTTYGTEWLDYAMGIKTVASLDEALAHISTYGSGHSECIITEDPSAAQHFQAMADAACIYVNAATSFTDGGQFGLGAEIGISTQKLGARGPMGLEEITTYKWLIDGHGQIRP